MVPASEHEPSRMVRAAERFASLRDGWLDAFCEVKGLDPSCFTPRRHPYPDEVAGVLRAVDEGVVVIDHLGRCTLPGLRKSGVYELLRSAKSKNGAVGIHYGLEWFTHIASVAELIVDHGWPKDQIEFETLPFDANVFTRPDSPAPIIVAEAKKKQVDLEVMLAQLTTWAELGITLTDTTSSSDHRKYWGLLGIRMYRQQGVLKPATFDPPKFFWAVGPGIRRAFDVEQ